MNKNLFCSVFIILVLASTSILNAQKVSAKLPWSGRMTESEIVRYPESWQFDFQPKLKCDYCHSLELHDMRAVYDVYGTQKLLY